MQNLEEIIYNGGDIKNNFSVFGTVNTERVSNAATHQKQLFKARNKRTNYPVVWCQVSVLIE